jgi:hypothetical protein
MNTKTRIKTLTTILLFFSSLFTLHHTLFTRVAIAVCPVCTVAIGAGLGLSRWLGIDDTISGIWIGGFLMSISFWTVSWLMKKKFKPFQNLNKNHITLLSFVFWYAVVIIPLWTGNIIGNPLNTILGIDKIIFGITLGSCMFFVGTWIDKKIRSINKKQLFLYQKVVFPTVSLTITSFITYYFGGYLY